MRSRAQIKSHPIHPMLIVFPIAFLVGALAFDAIARAGGGESFGTTGSYLAVAGIVMGLVAGVPGFIDYVAVVPPNSSARTRATQHMLVNVSALVAFGVAWFLRAADHQPSGWTLALEALGVGLLTSGGWMGGTLVYRNQIGVDHRYAEAGKWQESAHEARPGEPFAVARADELKVDAMKLLHVNDRRIVLARTADGYVAFDDRCTHKGGPLADGAMICGTVQCPWHGSQFDARTGAVKAGPADESIRTYRVEQSGDEIRLIL